jgi:hypothetical protein
MRVHLSQNAVGVSISIVSKMLKERVMSKLMLKKNLIGDDSLCGSFYSDTIVK